MNITAEDFELRSPWSDMHCQFVGTTEASQGQKVTIADFFKKDWKMKELCSKSCLKKQAKDIHDHECTARQTQGKQDELLKTEQEEKKTRAKAMQARKPTMASMNTKLVVS